MLKTHWRIVSWIERILDNALIIAAFFISYHMRDDLFASVLNHWMPFPRDLQELAEIEQYYLFLALSLPVFNASLSVLKAYHSMRRHVWYHILRVSVFASLISFLSIAALLFLLKVDLSRSFAGLFCITAGGLLFIERMIVLRVLRFFRVRGKNFRNLLIVGTGTQARNVYSQIASQPELGLKVQGFVDVRGAENKLGQFVPDDASAVYDLQARVIADADSFENTLKKYAIDEVVFTEVVRSFPIVHELSEIAVDEGVAVTFTADLFSVGVFTSEVGRLGDLPVINFVASPGSGDTLQLFMKRAFDVLASLLGIIFLSPLFLLAILAILLEDGRPIFFTQRRVGLNGRTFTLLKFRSMVKNAEELLPNLQASNEMKGPVFKMADDPRITRVGRFLRKYSIDEFPQLFNVLRGDMSLVGPRPPLPSEVKHYKRRHRKRLSMRPGLTCTWQISGRNDIPDFEEWAKMDLAYIDNWSFSKDLVLILKTIPVVLSGEGAR